ncbi:hypothetical protein CY34DRAFT_110776 [Suillus luteus UH-Slu-Lm8-n1]|uniref:CxC6 like cysteine cluster associated with KDZ domain-containing protein n=1 Tax=Suillus luteus UH-Slu-Lm8-n1 TaxID=930992 RepID=A0A0D0A491_9AGAM|nr:hypothetical protein CY34DRAFT_110776 [Suillus luteus UH-Slu-Lm8-n1]
MRERTERIITHGQEELPHACDGCLRVFEMPDGTLSRTEVVVTDGVTVGHPCCAVPRCTNPLANNRHRYCSINPAHKRLELVCAVEGCDRPVTCDDGDEWYEHDGRTGDTRLVQPAVTVSTGVDDDDDDDRSTRQLHHHNWCNIVEARQGQDVIKRMARRKEGDAKEASQEKIWICVGRKRDGWNDGRVGYLSTSKMV